MRRRLRRRSADSALAATSKKLPGVQQIHRSTQLRCVPQRRARLRRAQHLRPEGNVGRGVCSRGCISGALNAGARETGIAEGDGGCELADFRGCPSEVRARRMRGLASPPTRTRGGERLSAAAASATRPITRPDARNQPLAASAAVAGGGGRRQLFAGAPPGRQAPPPLTSPTLFTHTNRLDKHPPAAG